MLELLFALQPWVGKRGWKPPASGIDYHDVAGVLSKLGCYRQRQASGGSHEPWERIDSVTHRAFPFRLWRAHGTNEVPLEFLYESLKNAGIPKSLFWRVWRTGQVPEDWQRRIAWEEAAHRIEAAPTKRD